MADERTFTAHQVERGLREFLDDEEHIREFMEQMATFPEREGAAGYTDDELKGTARDGG